MLDGSSVLSSYSANATRTADAAVTAIPISTRFFLLLSGTGRTRRSARSYGIEGSYRTRRTHGDAGSNWSDWSYGSSRSDWSFRTSGDTGSSGSGRAYGFARSDWPNRSCGTGR